jgi:hypothetical protein
VHLNPTPTAPAVKNLQIAGHRVDFDGKTLTGLPTTLTVV